MGRTKNSKDYPDKYLVKPDKSRPKKHAKTAPTKQEKARFPTRVSNPSNSKFLGHYTYRNTAGLKKAARKWGVTIETRL